MRLIAALIVAILGASSEGLAKPKETRKAKGTTVETPFAQAQAAFRKEVAGLAQKSEVDLRITPATEALTTYREQNTGDLVAFQAEWLARPPRAAGPKNMAVRGFASPSGEVVLAKKDNLGVLLRATNFLDEKQSLPAKAIAERLLWMMSPPGSPNHQLLETGGMLFMPPPLGSVQIEPPRIERRTDGSARLIFFYSSVDPAGIVTQKRAELRSARDYTVDPFAL